MTDYLRYRCAIGFLVDAEVLLWEDDHGIHDDRPVLAMVVGPAPPEDQPGAFDRHANQWANDAIPDGDEFVSLRRPDGERVEEVTEADLWPEGAFIREWDQTVAYQNAEHGYSPKVVKQLYRQMDRGAEVGRLIDTMNAA